MNILVCIKQVPDTETRIRIPDGGRWIEESGVTFVLSPFDEFAVEEAIRLRDARGGEVTVLGAGPERVSQALRTCLAMGADRAIHLKDDRIERADSLTIARALAAAVAGKAFDLVLLGKQGVGTDNAQVGPMLAELLDMPQVTAVSKLEVGEGKLTAHREIEGAVEIVESSLPAVVTAEKGLNEPRYPSLKGIMASKKKPLDTVDLASIGVALPAEGAEPVRWTALALPPARGEGKIFKGDAAESAREVARLLREEAKVI
jgi:electron transfer flavoprotein beta subunit